MKTLDAVNHKLTLDDIADVRAQLVGIERAVHIRVGASESPEGHSIVPARVDAGHERQLTRETVTASVHYVRFAFTAAQVERFATGPVRIAIDHQAYAEGTNLDEATRAELLEDLGA